MDRDRAQGKGRASGKGKKDPRDKRARRNGKEEEEEEEEKGQACSLPILRVALVGCGWFSLRAHLPALQKLTKAKGRAYRVELAACVARSDASVKNLRRRLGKSEIKVYSSIEMLLSDESIDVVDIVLPIPATSRAIEQSLAAGKCVISEKPASHSPEAACQLWSDYCRLSRVNTSEDRGHGGHHPHAGSIDAAAADAAAAATCALDPRRGATWCVSENWAHKPCVKRVSQLLREGAVGCDMRYNVVLSQNIPKEEELGWRAKAGETYQGGWALDVGVHAVRALRVWFGHVEQVKCKQWGEEGEGGAEATAGTRLIADISHEKRGENSIQTQGQLSMRFKAGEEMTGGGHREGDGEVGGQVGESTEIDKCPSHGVCVIGDVGKLVWEFDSDLVIVYRKDGSVHEYRVEGDGWVSGGIKDSLDDCLQECADSMGLLCTGRGANVHQCSPQAAIRDAAVIWATMESHCRGGNKLDPEELLVKSGNKLDPEELLVKSGNKLDPEELLVKSGNKLDPEELLVKSGNKLDPEELLVKSGNKLDPEELLVKSGNKLDPEELLVKSLCDGTMEEGSFGAAGSESRTSLWRDRPRGRRRYNGVGSRRSLAADREVVCMCKADVVAEMQLGGNSVRATGCDQSWSRLGEASEAGSRLDMRGMSRILSVEAPSTSSGGVGRVRCEPGCILGELTSALAARGLCLASLPILADQTVGGAVATGSHGSSLHHGTVSDMVLEQVVVLPGGKEIRLLGDDDLSKATRTGMGMLGTCVEVELEVTRAYQVEREIRVVDLAVLVTETGEEGLIRTAEHAWCFVRIGGDTAVAVLLHRCGGRQGASDHADDAGSDDPKGKMAPGGGKEAGRGGGGVCGREAREGRSERLMYNGQNWFPHPLPPVLDGGWEQGDAEGAWLSMQYSLPLSAMHDGLDVVVKLGRDGSLGMRGRIVELKFLAASDKTLMGPNTRRSADANVARGSSGGRAERGGCEVVCFNLWWREDYASKQVPGGIRGMMNSFEKEMQKLGAVPHWGKMHSLPPGYHSVLAGSTTFDKCVSSMSARTF